MGEQRRLSAARIQLDGYFCWHHRFQPWIALVAVLGFVGTLFGIYRDAFEPWFSSKKFHATISPRSAAVSLNTWTDHQSITVHNPTNEVLYAVWIAITVVEKRFDETKLKFDTEIMSSEGRKFEMLGARKQPLTAPPQAFLITGKDPDASPALLMVLRSVAPGESKTYLIRSTSRMSVASTHVSVEYRFTVLSESLEPDGFTSKLGHVNVNFRKMPKRLTINTLDEYWLAIMERKWSPIQPPHIIRALDS